MQSTTIDKPRLTQADIDKSVAEAQAYIDSLAASWRDDLQPNQSDIECALSIIFGPEPATVHFRVQRPNPRHPERPQVQGRVYTADPRSLAKMLATALPDALSVWVLPQPLLHPADWPSSLTGEPLSRQIGNADVLCWQWLIIDCDSKRQAHVSASAEEYDAALTLSRHIADELQSKYGWPAPVMRVASGNGAHLWYRVSLANDQPNRALVSSIYRALAKLYTSEAVAVDIKMANPGRVIKVPGTIARKGPHTPDRPHRVSHILEQNHSAKVSDEALATIAALAPVPELTRAQGDVPAGSPAETAKWLDEWLATFEVDVLRGPEEYQAGLRYLVPCPIADQNTTATSLSEAAIIIAPGGGLAFRCQHAHEEATEALGRQLDWRWYRRAIERRAEGEWDPIMDSRWGCTDIPLEIVEFGDDLVGVTNEGDDADIEAEPTAESKSDDPASVAVPEVAVQDEVTAALAAESLPSIDPKTGLVVLEPLPRPSPSAAELAKQKIKARDAQLDAEDQAETAAMEAVADYSSDEDLEMPEAAMYGRLGEIARSIDMPLGLAYPAALALASGVPAEDRMVGSRVNVYAVLLAYVGAGKNATISRLRDTLRQFDEHSSAGNFASDRGLMLSVGAVNIAKEDAVQPAYRHLCKTTGEIGATLNKGGIDNSSLLTVICDLYDETRYETADKTGVYATNCRLSWLGGLPLGPAGCDPTQAFREAFGKKTTDGLYDRVIFGFTSECRRFNPKWKPRDFSVRSNLPLDDEIEPGISTQACVTPDAAKNGYQRVMFFDAEAERLVDAFVEERAEHRGEDTWTRVEYTLRKVSVISAAFNFEASVTPDCVRAAIRFIGWQLKLRRKFGPSGAANQTGEIAEAVLAAYLAYERRNPGSFGDRYKLDAQHGWTTRYGPRLIRETIDALVANRRLLPKHRVTGRHATTNKPEVRRVDRRFLRVATAADHEIFDAIAHAEVEAKASKY